jgi:uracil phosphoribosyltransferase
VQGFFNIQYPTAECPISKWCACLASAHDSIRTGLFFFTKVLLPNPRSTWILDILRLDIGYFYRPTLLTRIFAVTHSVNAPSIMVFNLSEKDTIANRFIAELRDLDIQQDRMRFRRNLERIGEILAYEISQKLHYEPVLVETPLGSIAIPLPADKIVLATILRAGLPMHQGMLHYFDQADNVFIAAFRKHHKDGTFDIQLDYISTPNLEECILIISDPMLATGASVDLALKALERYGKPRAVHIATVIASTAGVEAIQRRWPKAGIWAGAI